MYIKSHDNLPLFYEVFEPLKKNGPILEIVFLHGLGGDSNALIPVTQEIQKKLPNTKIILYDLRGHGLSTKKYPKSEGSFEKTHIKDLQTILQQLKIKKPILMGHCMGGNIVQEYIVQELNPKPTQTIIICSALKIPPSFLSRKLWYKILKKISQNTKKTTKKRTVGEHMSYKNSHDWSIFRLWTDIKNMGGIQCWLLSFGAAFGWKNKDLTNIDNSNTSFIWGKKDRVILLMFQLKQIEKLKKAKKIFLNSNHITPISNPRRLAKTITNELKI